MTRARHVFHVSTCGSDRILAWREATQEPVFIWGNDPVADVRGTFFASIKRKFASWLEATSDAVISVYHDGSGVDVLGPMDPCPQKILFQHHWFPRWEQNFEWMIRRTGKAAVSHSSFVELIRSRFAWIPERYIYHLPPPLLKPSIERRSGGSPKRRTGIWMQDQPWKQAGNRLRAIADQWGPEAGELEIVCRGGARPAWARKNHFLWSSDLPLEFALLRQHTWDSVLLLNDYSLDSPWFLTALSLDCFPLVPEGSGASRSSLWQVDSAPSPYPWGDVPAMIGLLAQWRSARPELLPSFRQWRNLLLQQDVPPKKAQDGYEPGGFREIWDLLKEDILRQSPPSLRPRKPARALYPVSWFERLQRLRMGR